MANANLYSRVLESGALRYVQQARAASQMPASASGIGCVISAGGAYMAQAYAAITLLRRHGWQHPVQVWHQSTESVRWHGPNPPEFVNASAVMRVHRVRRMHGWSMKAYAIAHCPFEHVLSLDADSFAQSDLSRIFDTPEYADTGLVLTPDLNKCRNSDRLFHILKVPVPDNYIEAESGQVWINRKRLHAIVSSVNALNQQSELFWKYVHGDKEMWPTAMMEARLPYTLTPMPTYEDHGFKHRWFDGTPLTHHAMNAKRGGSFTPDVAELLREFAG